MLLYTEANSYPGFATGWGVYLLVNAGVGAWTVALISKRVFIMNVNKSISTRTARLMIVTEVAFILVLFFYLLGVFRSWGFGDWQAPLFGKAILSSILLFFVLPLSTLILRRRNPGAYGLTKDNLGQHARLALLALQVVLPATILFPVIGLLGTDLEHWLGSFILTVGFVAAGVVMLRYTRRVKNITETQISVKGFFAYVGLLIAGVGLVYLFQPISELIARIIIVLIFVGFLEEFFFRGYLQTRLNDVFGKPYSLYNVNFGAGLILASVIFGLFHPLSVTNQMLLPWAWALWTATSGLIFGFLREKSGGIVTPALLHGVMLLGGVFFGGSGS